MLKVSLHSSTQDLACFAFKRALLALPLGTALPLSITLWLAKLQGEHKN